MAKESGLPSTLSVDDSAGTLKDISNDVTSVTLGTPQNLQDVTGLDKSAIERLILLSDGQVQITGVFNDAADHIFAVFKTRTGTRTTTFAVSGQTLTMEMLVSDVSWQRNADGSMGVTATLMLQSGTVPVWS